MFGTFDYVRLLLTAFISRAAMRVICLFLPIKPNRVLFQCFREKQYACNPKYISEALMRLHGGELEIGWSFRRPQDFAFLEDMGARVLKARSWEGLKYMLTARVICVNMFYKPTIPRRRGQYFLRTWHGGGAYKRVGKPEKMPALKRLYVYMQQQGADLYLSSSRAFTQMTIRDSFGYRGEVMEAGMPRNDVLLSGGTMELRERTRAALKLNAGEKLVLYAPTYRDGYLNSAFDLDYAGLAGAMAERFGGIWRCAYRGHNFNANHSPKDSARGAIDATNYPDMQELLLIADALVTDYSSSIWDMSLMLKPAFLYATDLQDYVSQRDFYTDIRTWPFPLAENNAELRANILNFDSAKYIAKVKKHHEELGICESGRASVYAAERIYEICKGGKGK